MPTNDVKDPVLLVSGDSHSGPRLEETLRPYCPAAYLEAFNDYARSPQVTGYREIMQSTGFTLLNTTGHDDPHVRLADMDDEGVAAEVIFHTSFNGELMPFNDEGYPDPDDPELAAVGYRMYNRWLVDFCATDPDRLIGLAYVPMWDVDAAIEELTWVAEQGFHGVNFPATRPGWKHYNHRDWEPFWSIADEAGIVLATHAGGGADPAAGEESGSPLMLLEVGGHMNRRAIPRMILGGVFARHPGLKLAMTEQPGVWIPYTLAEMDSTIVNPPAPMYEWTYDRKPSDYFKSNVYVGTSFLAPFEAQAAVEDWWWENIFWGRDYPHPEGCWRFHEPDDEEPMAHLSLRHALGGLSRDHKVEAILGETAIRVYGLDRDKLRAVADRIGPSLKHLTTPLDSVPALDGPERKGYGHFAFRTVGSWG